MYFSHVWGGNSAIGEGERVSACLGVVRYAARATTFSKLRTHREVRRHHGTTATGGDVLVVMRKESALGGRRCCDCVAFAGAGRPADVLRLSCKTAPGDGKEAGISEWRVASKEGLSAAARVQRCARWNVEGGLGGRSGTAGSRQYQWSPHPLKGGSNVGSNVVLTSRQDNVRYVLDQ